MYFRPLRKSQNDENQTHTLPVLVQKNTNVPSGIKILQSARRSSNCQCEYFHSESKHELAKVRKLDFTILNAIFKRKKIVALFS